jgi:ATP-dependent Lon protease
MTLSQVGCDVISEEKAANQFIGKGKGLVLLLHGPVGVGKTMTAESTSLTFEFRPQFHHH